jgi:3-oxoacyl-(acyl-carrier-protein) synthase
MMQPLYIKSASAISPQHSFEGDGFLNPVLFTMNNQLYVADPDYRPYINPVAIRRMSRIIKMGISAGMRSLQDAGVTTPDGIIIGTGKGSVTDTEHFLEDMIQLKEGALNPTYFIQSTYNSINGWLALQTKCNGYSQTYVHRGHSLEMALLDAQMMVNETVDTCNLLVGCYDEMSPDYFSIKHKVDYWKKQDIDSRELFKHGDTAGSIGGEGVAFFTVSNNPAQAICSMEAIKMLQNPDRLKLNEAIADMLPNAGITVKDISIVISGENGDSRTQWIYDAMLPQFTNASTVRYKHLCGEYDTTTGFSLWLATKIYGGEKLPGLLAENVISSGYTLILNHNILDSVSLLLLKN